MKKTCTLKTLVVVAIWLLGTSAILAQGTLVAHWPMDFLDGDTAVIDASGNGNLLNFSTRIEPHNVIKGVVGNALELNFDSMAVAGTNVWADNDIGLTDPLSDPLDGDFTLSFWLQLADSTGDGGTQKISGQPIIKLNLDASVVTNPPGEGFIVMQNPDDGGVGVWGDGKGGNWQGIKRGPKNGLGSFGVTRNRNFYYDNSWHFYTFTREDTLYSFYVDGKLMSSSGGNIYSYSGYAWVRPIATIDEMKIIKDHVMTSDEMQSEMGLVAHWTMDALDGDTAVIDASGNGNLLNFSTRIEPHNVVPGKIGNALELNFDSMAVAGTNLWTDNDIGLTDPLSDPLDGDFTLSFWLQLADSTGDGGTQKISGQPIIKLNLDASVVTNPPGEGFIVMQNPDGGGVGVWADGTGGNWQGIKRGPRNGLGSYDVTKHKNFFYDNSWHHYEFTRSDSLYSMYVDGQLVAMSYGNIYSYSGYVWIRPIATIDDVKIYSTASKSGGNLIPVEMKPEENLVAYWSMDEVFFNKGVFDQSGNGNMLQFQPGIEPHNFKNGYVEMVTDSMVSGGGIYKDADEAAFTPWNKVLSNQLEGDFTIDFWLNLADSTGDGGKWKVSGQPMIRLNEPGVTNSGLSIMQNPDDGGVGMWPPRGDGNPRWYGYSIGPYIGVNSYPASGDKNTYYDNSWHRYQIIREGSIYYLYIDGNEVSQAPGSVFAAGGNVWIRPVGAIDEIKIYSAAIVEGTPNSDDASLSALVSSEGVLSPGFETGTYLYNVELPAGTTAVPTTTATPTDANATVEVVDAATLTDTTVVNIVAANRYDKMVYKISYTVSSTAVNTDALSVFKIYPIPTSDVLHLSNLDEKASELLILDAVGKIVRQISIHSVDLTINVSSLDAGLYFIRLSDREGNVASRKFAVVK